MNKRQAQFIMQLPDGYEWQFLPDDKFLVGFKDQSILAYEIIGDELKKCDVNYEPEKKENELMS